uniref:Uncharacterized protein n=1 Tax=Arundo donax TaxID=35708 RepID=A0A0A9AUP4_ARUDO
MTQTQFACGFFIRLTDYESVSPQDPISHSALCHLPPAFCTHQ